jgi:Mg-chelatase subunit ChlD
VAAPTVFEAAAGGAGGLVLVPAAARTPKRGAVAGHGATVITGETAGVVALDPQTGTVDPAVRAAAREIAARLWIPRAPDQAMRRGAGMLRSMPYRGGLDDIDLDRTLEVMTERPTLEDEDIIIRERVRASRAVVLVVDASGSMRDERIRTAAATVGALASELNRDDLAVLTFWSDAAWLSHFGSAVAPQQLLDALVTMPARGLTNLELPLRQAARELALRPGNHPRVILLSDCVHNAGPDPRPAAAGLPRLDILLDIVGERDIELARELAGLGRGRLRPISSHRDVAPALTELFAG